MKYFCQANTNELRIRDNQKIRANQTQIRLYKAKRY